MKTRFSIWLNGLMVLVLTVCFLAPASITGAIGDGMQQNVVQLDRLIDGTQLVNETKQAVADRFNVSPLSVTATYCCQLPDGRYRYSASFGLQSGYINWTILEGQIIEEDAEGF